MAAVDRIVFAGSSMACFQLLQWKANQCTSYLWSGVASITQPRQLGTTNILMHAPKSGLFRVVTSQNGCYTENVRLFSLMQFFILKLQQLAVY